jgi:replicative DNA helicase
MKSPALHFDVDRAVSWERAVLGCLLESPDLWSDAAGLNAGNFILPEDRKIFSAIADLHEHSSTADAVSVHAQLGESVPAGAIAALLEGCVPENFHSYLRQFRESIRDKRFHEQYAQLGEAKTAEDPHQHFR